MNDTCEAFRRAIEEQIPGAVVPDIEPGRMHRYPTNNVRSDKAGWCKLFDDERAGVFGCYRQGISEIWHADDVECLTPAERAERARQIAHARAEREAEQQERWAANATRNAATWAAARSLSPGDSATLYLKRRGMAGLWPLPESLRLHRGLEYWDDGEMLGIFPALLAPLVGPDGRMLALHRTYLTKDGRKADVPQPKKLTGAAGYLSGSCIPLHRPVRGALGIAEGIETALAAWAGSGVPVVAAYSAGNLAAWRWPADLQRVVIFGDNDAAGRAAALALSTRVKAAGLRCEVMTPADEGTDWCDVLAARQPIMVEGGEA